MAKEKDTREKQPASKKKILLLILPILLLLIAAGGAGFYLLGESSASDTPRSASPDSPEKEKELGPLVEMDDFVVNIAHKDTSRFLKIGITLEAGNKESSAAIEKRMPQIRDAVLLLVGNKKYDDIKDLQGKMQLKADLLARIRELAGNGEIVNLYLTDFVVQ